MARTRLFIRRSLACLAAAGIALPAAAALKEGDAAPDFQAQASLAGKAFAYSLREALRTGPVVVYFYPAAFTGGCNIQAHSFATRIDQFVAVGATVVGVSLDKIDKLNAFSADPDTCAGKLAVASDASGAIARSYQLQIAETPAGRTDTRGGAIDHGRAERTTFVVTPDGKVAATIGGVAPEANVTQALETVRRLGAAKPKS